MSDVLPVHRHSPTGTGPHSRPGKLQLLDKRSAEAKFIAKERTELIAAVGGSPSDLTLKLIDSLSRLALRLHLMDRQAMADAAFSERNGRQFLAWRAQYERGLMKLATLGAKDAKGKAGSSIGELQAIARG